MAAYADLQAATLAYKANASAVDKVKLAKYATDQQCNNCALYKGKARSASGDLLLFGAEQVVGKDWCSAYAKKA